MRTLIDGYNLMFAGGLPPRKLGPDQFRQIRHRFLNNLAARLDVTEAHLTTIVFDAAAAPPDRASVTHHKGMTILYATDVDDADTRIEDLIAHHSSPKTLTVVSSDHRVQKAALRRRSRVVGADAFWSELDARKSRRKEAAARREAEPVAKTSSPSAGESAYWAREFAEVDASPDARELFGPDPDFPTDADLARIAREVDAEFRR